MNLIDFFDSGARQHPHDVCFADVSGTALTYSQAQTATFQMARGLRVLKLAAGFHGAILAGNVVEAFVAVLAIVRAEGVWLPVNVRNAPAANAQFLEEMDCDVLFYERRWIEQVDLIRATVPGIRHYVCLDVDQHDGPAMQRWLREQAGDPFPAVWHPEAVAVILSTGGTTGRSKGVMLTHRNIAAMCANQMAGIEIGRRMCYLAAAPITHTTGLLALPFMARGARVLLMDGIDPPELLRVIEAEKVNVVFLPPTAIYMLLAQPRVRDFDYSSLRYLLYGAAPISPEKLAEAIDVFGPVLFQGYGQSEVPGTISVLKREDHFVDGSVAPRKRLLSAGRPCAFTRVALLGDDGQIHTDADVRGEIVAQGDIVMKGYYKNPQATAEASVDGWHCTGDIGYFDSEGFLYVVDRKKDIIISGGFNVYSSEVEAALMAHPAVKDCAVIGVPDEKWGEAVKGIVELRRGHLASAQDLIDFAKTQLGSVKAPKSLDIVAQLPRSNVGKVLKSELRAPYWAERDRAV